MIVLKQQHKVVSKKVLQNILEQRTACNDEFSQINEVTFFVSTAVAIFLFVQHRAT